MNRKYLLPAVVLLLTAVGFLLRLFRIDAVPFRGDEAFTVQNWMSLPLSESLTRIATIEPHPFLNYVLFRFWGLLGGTTEFSARYWPALVNIIGIPASYALGTRLSDRRVGVVAAFLWAFHPYLIWHSQDARNYAVWSGMSVVTLWVGVSAAQRNRVLDWLLYLLVSLITVQIFYFEWFMVVGFSGFVLLVRWRDRVVVVRLLFVLVILLLVSVLSFGLLQGELVVSGAYGGTTGAGLSIARLVNEFLPVLFFGEAVPSGMMRVLAVVVVVILLVWLFLARQFGSYLLTVFVLVVGLIPFVLLSIISLRFDVFAPRYVLAVVSVLNILLAFVIVRLSRMVKHLGVLLLVGWLVVASYSLANYWFVNDYAKAKPWPDVATYLAARVTPDDLVIQLSVDPAFGFYYGGSARDIGLPASPVQSSAEIEHTLEISSQTYTSLWLVGHTFPDWPNYGVVETWLQRSMQLVRSTDIAGMHVQQYMRWQVSEIEPTPLAEFGDAVQLVGTRVLLPPEPTSELTVWLYWKPLARTTLPYKVFLHLEGDINPAAGTALWSQDDRYPQNGRISTTTWVPAAIYRDVYVLPLKSVPAGSYSLRAGFYEPDTGDRLRLNTGADSALIQTVTLP